MVVTTRNGALKDRRVTRSMAAHKPTSSGVVKRKAAAAPKAARKTAQKLKKTVLKKQNVANAEPTFEDRATIDTNREMNTTTINDDTKIRAVTRSMTKNGDQTVTVKPSTSTKGKGAFLKNRSKAATSHEGSAPPAARPTTRSMTNNVENTVIIVPPEPPTQAERNLTAPSLQTCHYQNYRPSSRSPCKRQDYDHSSRSYRQTPKPVPHSDVRLRVIRSGPT
ncbi:hypothetical protein KCU75_g22, partial [Aureobasidium melanogenum]